MIDLAKSPQLSLSDLFTRSLACAAISPGLRSILVFDTTSEPLRFAAQNIAQMLEFVNGQKVTLVTLGTYEAEDDLWGSWALGGSEKQSVQWKPGLLTGDENNSKLRLVVIPDLAKLSLAAARACVVLMGGDVVHLERHGQQAQWQPNLCWLAGCATSQVGMVSPHLLDRFALRLMGQAPTNIDKVASIREWIDDSVGKQIKLKPLPRHISQHLKKALQIHPTITPQATARILDYITDVEVYSPRREIALGRLSVANAQLMGATEIAAENVDIAALMIGLKRGSKQTKKPSNSISVDQPDSPTPTNATPTSEEQPEPFIDSEPVYESDESKALIPSIVTVNSAPGNPYPEDEAPVEREAASLRLPTHKFRSSATARGSIIGVEKTTALQDLALVRTLQEAAKFQPIRQKFIANGQRRLVLLPTDLHCNRRAPVAEQMLMLILDHTCLRDCNWQEELLPYLSWAYVERASVCLIQVGAAQAQYELRAEKVMAQSILVPRISAGIDAASGKATPLAHGLDLALQTLRHALQHGRSTVQQVVLVVISDGRGNVPLQASRLGRITPPVGRKGIEDALLQGKRIRGLDGVKAVLLNPQPKQYAELPLALAEALGATMVAIPPLYAVEEE